MAGSWFTALLLLIPLLSSPHFHTSSNSSLLANQIERQSVIAEDTLVNYCKLVRAAYFYGQKFADKQKGLTAQDVEFFNGLWKEVFSEPFYQTGITTNEFVIGARFGEGNQVPFPPSKRYHNENPDTYLLFHIAKEVGMIDSETFKTCPSCVELSIAKINAYLKGTSLHAQISQMWLGTSTLKRITSTQEIKDFWIFLRCMFIDDKTNPILKPYFINLPPVVKCPDTTTIQCKDEIKPKVSVGYRHCEIGGRIDTIGPKLVHGIDNCPGAIYHIKFIARDQCLKSDSCIQVFVIENEKHAFTCPKDTIVPCIKDLVKHTPKVTSSCSLLVKQSTYGPLLVRGKENCPDAVYELEYTATDTCGREVTCTQKITIRNDPPKITCPPDQTVECKSDIKEGIPKYVLSCHAKPKKTSVSGPKLVLGKEDCPGAVYELMYEVTDSCDRTVKCVQKFTIDNKGPEIVCPPNQEVLCYEDISTSPPSDVVVACNMNYTVDISDPQLIIGKMNCVGSVYLVVYKVTDACGRTDECEQLFTILQPDLKIECPPDRSVQCAEDITPEEPEISIACKLAYTVTTEGPELVRGDPDCPGAEYEIRYTVKDTCGRVKECRQLFTIDNPAPEIICPPDQTINCLEDVDSNLIRPIITVACELDYTYEISEPRLVSGVDNCDGAVYAFDLTVTDACERSATCTWRVTLRIPDPEITCAPDRVIECEDEIQPEAPTVVTYCDQTYTVTTGMVEWIDGIRNCPGAQYSIEYTITDDCNRTYSCVQLFTIDNAAPQIICPPDREVNCEDDITIEDVETIEVCEEGDLTAEGPTLLSGVPGCPGTVYTVIYQLIDSCGRTAVCTQHFTLSGDALEITCPPDTFVRSKADITAFSVIVSSSCDVDFDLTYSPPVLISGVDGQGGAVYGVTCTVTDDCGRSAMCIRRYHLVDIPDDGVRILCDCLKEYKNVSLDLIQDPNDRLNRDIAALIKKYGCEKLKGWIQGGVVELWNAWSQAEILGGEAGIANDIARRGNINIVMQNLEKISKAIEILEEAINGEPKKTMEIITEWGLTEGITALSGSGTPAAVFGAIKTLGEFAAYLNNEILIINIKTLANYADQDPYIFDPDHYLREYAKIREVKPGDRVTWNDIHNPFRIAIWEYAQHRMNDVKLPPLNEIWNNQQNMNLLRTVTYTMLKEVCQYWCYKLTLKQNLNKLIQEQSLLLRFKAILTYLQNYDCGGNDKPCTMDHAQLVERNGQFICECETGYKWDPGKIRCLPYSDCSTIANSVEVYQGDRYDCDCAQGFEWNADGTACIPVEPDCPTLYPNSEAKWDQATNQWFCYCIEGYEWNADRTACMPMKPDCPSIYPNSEAKWDAATNQWLCYCIEGYEWNADRTICIPKQPDCPSIYPNSEAKWDPATNQWLCYCIQGYEWNADRTACIPLRPDCPSIYPNSEAQWDAATNQWLCYCMQGYEWNADRTACIPLRPDCPSIYPNSEAQWDAATNQWLCYCIQGYEWNANRTACVPSRPDCPSFYANTEAIWDQATNQWLCNCISGYVWNATRTGCELPAPDCNTFYPNSVPQWDFITNQYLCNCPIGYNWNASRTQCIPFGAPDCVTFYPNSTPYWDPATNQFLCYCLPGFEWNATRTECVPLGTGNRDDPQVNPQQQKTGECNVTYGSGANEPEQYTIDVHQMTGSLQFSFNTYTVKDRIHIYYSGNKIFDSGCVGTSGSQTFTLNGFSSVFRIVVDPLCDPTESDTQWDFKLGCPQ